MFANGADPASNRIGVDVVVGKGVDTGLACAATTGVRVSPMNGDISNGTWGIGFSSAGVIGADFLASSESYAALQCIGINTFGVSIGGTHTVGIDVSGATISNQAIRLAAGQQIAFDATGGVTMEYDSGSDSILFKKNGVTKQTLSMV